MHKDRKLCGENFHIECGQINDLLHCIWLGHRVKVQRVDVVSAHKVQKLTLLHNINNGDSRVVGGQAVPGLAWVQQPLLHMAVVIPGISGPSFLDG